MFRNASFRIVAKIGRTRQISRQLSSNSSSKSQNKNNKHIGWYSTVGLLGVSRCYLGFSAKNKDEDDPIIWNIKRGRLSTARHEYDNADRYFHMALYAAEDKFKNKEMEKEKYIKAKLSIYDDMANLAFSQQQFNKAEKLYKETMKALLQDGKELTSNAMVELNIKLATIYAMQKKSDFAQRGYQEAVDIMENKIKKNPESDQNTYALYGLALESYGRYLIVQKHLKDAEPIFVKAETIATKILGKDHPQRIVLLNDIASVQIMSENYTEAEKTLTQALEVGTVADAPELPALYSNLGALYLRTSNLDDAEKNCTLGLEKAKEKKNKYAQGQARFCLKKILEERQKDV